MTEKSFRQHVVTVTVPEGTNVILGQTHFVKTVEDLYEALITASPSLRFGIGFCEASQKRLIRSDGNDTELIELAEKTAFDIGCGHAFVIYLRDGFPINVLPRVKAVEEVCRIFCATANPLQVLVAETDQGRGVLGVVDGAPPAGIETDSDKAERRDFLRKIGYKR
ncbi:MAG: adenosine monophosphate-protein transferase [Candidatus Zixiibacteriota bacterium]|nr:MAG: adenosine monophosphate-protein transferase [candidate division Zixibacteria bacterium]